MKRVTHKKHYRIKKTYKKKRVIKGGELVTIPITKITLTKPIIEAIKSMRPSLQITGFKMDSNPPGFRLSRLNQPQNMSKPIQVKQIRNTGYYTIIDGRHRFAKLVALGEDTVTVDVI